MVVEKHFFGQNGVEFQEKLIKIIKMYKTLQVRTCTHFCVLGFGFIKFHNPGYYGPNFVRKFLAGKAGLPSTLTLTLLSAQK